ncbi:MAG: hypothetical protein AAGN35_09545 [Bacteroidota bacterium]
MNRKITSVFLPLLTCALFFQPLPGQLFQQLHAYDPGTGVETGPYHDVACLSGFSPVGATSISIGESFGPTTDGILSYNDPNGLPLVHQEWVNPFGNPVEGKAIDELPSGDIVVAFYDAAAGATDVIRLDVTGAILWGARVPDFRVQDVEADGAPYPSGEGIWLTGHSLGNNWLSAVGFDGGGGLIFANEYFIFDPIWNYASTLGFEVDFDVFNAQLVIAGTANIAGLPQTTMLHVRLDPGGGWIIGTSYSDASGNDYYHGKALAPHPFNPGHYIVTFEYSNNPAQPFDLLAAMEIDPFGGPIWINAYPGMGLFGGTNFITNGVRADFGGLMLTCGWFTSPVTGTPTSGYTFSFDPFGGPAQFNEYEIATPYPPSSTLFWGMDMSPIFGSHVIAGRYGTAGSGGWPFGTNSFWLVGADPLGNANCGMLDFAPVIGLGPNISPLNPVDIALPPLMAMPLRPQIVDQRNTDQCTFPKRSFAEASQAESGHGLQVIHATDGTVRVEIVGELTGEGKLHLVDLNGKILTQLEARLGNQVLNTESLSAGIYFLRYDLPGIGGGTEKVVLK